MSDSSALSDVQHDDVQLESALRSTVQRILQDKDRENLTIKRVRTSVEELLGLGDGFFKNDNDWRDRSKEFIQEEVNARDSNPSSQCQPQSPKSTAQKLQAPASQAVKPKSKNREQHPAFPEPAYASHKKKRKVTSKDDLSASDEEQDKTSEVEKDRVGGADDSKSESELSVLLDEERRPRKKKKRQKSDPHTKSARQNSARKKGTSNAPVDPDAEEIKRLQGWLIKCGIRKMWHKELAPYESQRSKIKHLKEMLADVGMNGRYSKEKAEQIREERELKADLEAVQEGDKVWGKKEEEGEGAAGKDERPKRRLARGLQDLDFLNDDDGAETD